MNTQITPHGYKKALSDLKQWYQNAGPSAKVVLMIDLEDGEVWADCFLDSNSWEEYQSNSIVPLQLPRDEFGQMVAPTLRNIKESAVKMLKKIY